MSMVELLNEEGPYFETALLLQCRAIYITPSETKIPNAILYRSYTIACSMPGSKSKIPDSFNLPANDSRSEVRNGIRVIHIPLLRHVQKSDTEKGLLMRFFNGQWRRRCVRSQ
jgi:hypothetical protein